MKKTRAARGLKILSVELATADFNKVHEIASSTDRSVSATVRRMLHAGFTEHEQEQSPTPEIPPEFVLRRRARPRRERRERLIERTAAQ